MKIYDNFQRNEGYTLPVERSRGAVAQAKMGLVEKCGNPFE